MLQVTALPTGHADLVAGSSQCRAGLLDRSQLTASLLSLPDVAYDYYGERRRWMQALFCGDQLLHRISSTPLAVATASADQRIKIWRKDEAGKWQEEADWRVGGH